MTQWIFALPKVDAHCHVLDPQRFPYPADVAYRPHGQEVGSAAYFSHVMRAYGVRHALLVGPNSGYGTDNRCLLDAIAQGQGRFKGVAVVPAAISLEALRALRDQGVVGIAFNVALHGLDYYHDIDPLLAHLHTLGMWAQFQVIGDQLVKLLARIERAGVRTLIDHCGRPTLENGVGAAGVQALHTLARSGLAAVKLSGFAKFSKAGYPFDDCREQVENLLLAFGQERCLWASDWPYLRAESRLDYGTLLTLAASWFTPEQCQHMMWDTPMELFDWKQT